MPAPETQFYACPCWKINPSDASNKVDEIATAAMAVADTYVVSPMCANLRVLVYTRALAKSLGPIPKKDRERVESQILNVLRAEFDKVV
jgi:hypothetical protein